MIFDKTEGYDVSYFLFYFDNVAQSSGSGEEKARAIMTQLRGQAFQFHYKGFLRKAACKKRGKSTSLCARLLRSIQKSTGTAQSG